MKNKVLNYLFVFTLLFILSCSGNMLTHSITTSPTGSSAKTVNTTNLSTSSSTTTYTMHSPISILNNTAFATNYGFSGSGTQANPYIIENYNITTTTANAIDIENTNAYFIIRNGFASTNGSGYNGIYLSNVSNAIITGNIVNNTNEGIYSDGNNVPNYNITITNNFVSISSYGIDVEYTTNALVNNNTVINSTDDCLYSYYNTNVIFSNNYISNTGTISSTPDGIYADKNANNSVNFTGNIIENSYNGIALTTNATIENNIIRNSSDTGIILNPGSNNIIVNNTIENSDSGSTTFPAEAIYLANGADNNTIMYNTLFNNTGYGLDIVTSVSANNYNNITFNSFINNTYQANDGTSNTNYYNNTQFGNYWSNYNGTDANGDGIGDTPYNVTSSINDSFPLMHPAYITTTTPANKVISEGATGQQETWQVASAYDSFSYTVSINQSQVASGTVYGTSSSKSIPVSLDSLSMGSYTVTLSITNLNTSLSFQKMSSVTVADTSAPVLTVSSNSISYVAGTTGHFIDVNATDLHPGSYVVYENGTQKASGVWNTSADIQVSVDGLPAGAYVFNVTVFDSSNNPASVQVTITVTPAPTSTTPISSTAPITSTSSKGGNTPSFELLTTVIGLVAIMGYEAKRRRK